MVCGASAKALGFFRSHGVDSTSMITVRVVDRDIDPRLPHIGAYSAANKSIELLRLHSPTQRQSNFSLFGLPMDEALYQSVVVHELAHAIADQNFAYENPPVVIQEYIAYVTQLATMEPATRQRILAARDLPAYSHLDEMSYLYYAMDPCGFAVKAYRHFRSLDDPGKFLRDLLSGARRPARVWTE